MALCYQCFYISDKTKPLLAPKLDRNTMAAIKDCEYCGSIWVDRTGFCVDATCKIHGGKDA